MQNLVVTPLNAVLLPGLMCDHTFWAPLLQAPGRLRCQVVDYGDADTISAMAELALAVAPPVFSVVGHSMGGRVALEMLHQAPERVQKLVLMDTGCKPLAPGDKGEAEKVARMELLAVAQTQGVRAMAGQWVKAMVHPGRLDDAELIESIVTMFERKNGARFAHQQHALLSRPDATAVLAALEIPCLLVCGRQDGWSDLAQHQAMQTLVPHAQLCVIEEAGHMVLMERPEATVRALREFLTTGAVHAC